MPRWALLVLLGIAIITFWLLWTSVAQAMEQAQIAADGLFRAQLIFEFCGSLEETPDCHLHIWGLFQPGWLQIIQTRTTLAGFLLLAALIAGLAWVLFRPHRSRHPPGEGDPTR